MGPGRHWPGYVQQSLKSNWPQCCNLTLVSRSLKVQFHELIVALLGEPLAQGVDLGRQRLVIVEGIEECNEMGARGEIIWITLE